jgi:hypothetical protein
MIMVFYPNAVCNSTHLRATESHAALMLTMLLASSTNYFVYNYHKQTP